MRRCKRSLRNLIIEDCLRTMDRVGLGTENIRLINLQRIFLSGKGASLIGKVIYHRIKNEEFHAIGCHLAETFPLVTATAIRYWQRQRRIVEGFWMLPDRNVEGWVSSNHKVIIVEDVCRTGSSAVQVVESVRELVGSQVIGVVALVDYEEGARERFQAMGIKFDSIFTAKELLDIATNGGGRLAQMDRAVDF
jgi:orotate phosphoribosyltransferase